MYRFSLQALVALATIAAWVPLAAKSQNLVANGSFEHPGLVSGDYTVNYGGLATNGVPGWAFGLSTGTIPGVYDGLVSNNGGLNAGNIEDGTNAAFLQGGSMSQTITLNAGTYSLSFWAMGRSDTGTANPIAVSVDNSLSQSVTPDNTAENMSSDWQSYLFYFNAPSNGAYTLAFQATLPYAPPSDHTTFIDNVSIVAISAVPPPTILSEPSAKQVLYVGQSAQFTVQSTNTPPISYQWRVETNGIYVNLTNSGRFSGADSATLIISNLDLGDSTNYGVFLTNAGGTTNSTVAALEVLAMPPPTSPRGSVTVINPSFEDSPQLQDSYTAGYGSLNPQTGVPGWQFSSSGGDSYSGIVTESGSVLGASKYIPLCWQAAFIQGTGEFSQTVTFSPAGTNVARFWARGRSGGGAGAQTIMVSVDGVGIGTFTPLTTRWSLYTSLPFSVSPGVHVVTFTGTVPFSMSNRTSFIDGVQIVTPAEAAAVVPPTSPVYNIVFVGDSITYGATLADPGTQASAAQCMQSLGTRFNMAVRMSNQGHSGATTVDWLPSSSYFQSAETAATALASNQPGQLIFSIMLGVNDSAQSGPNGSPVCPSNFLANLQSIVDRFLADFTNACVIVHYPTWYSTNTDNGAVYDAPGLARLQSYFPKIDQLISNCAVTHPGRAFVGDKLAFTNFSVNYLTDLTAESGFEGTFYLHPNLSGAFVLGELWANAIVTPLNVTSNTSYVAWLQSTDKNPGAAGTGFSEVPTNALVRNGVLYGNPDGLAIVLNSASADVNITADIRSDLTLTAVLQSSSNLINWSPVSWSPDANQNGVLTGFTRYSLHSTIGSEQNEEFYRVELNY
jgi:GDSL-like Lipase/Acylhydrolase family/Immunoglobulin I-set domain